MIRVQVTDRLIFEANELLDGINQNSMKKRPSFKDEDSLSLTTAGATTFSRTNIKATKATSSFTQATQ
jgi:hypothetical protein